MRGSPRSDRDAGQVAGLSSNRGGRRDRSEAFSEEKNQEHQTRSGALLGFPTEGRSGCARFSGVESMPLFSLLSRGKQSPWDGVDAHPRRKKRREMIVGCSERTPRVRGVPRLTRRRWA